MATQAATSEIEITAPPGEQLIMAPVRGKARIDVLDILRGLAILSIFYMNLPDMAGPTWASMNDPRTLGWTLADQNAYVFIKTFLSGTQRGLLEMLFGAGMLVMFRKAMDASGPVGVADIYIRRNLWLLFFGMLDVYLLLWYGDIIHGYALCGLAIFPFRRLRPRTLLIIGLLFASLNLVGGGFQYGQRILDTRQVERIEAQQASGHAISADDGKTLKDWNERKAKVGKLDPQERKQAAEEVTARAGSLWDYMQWNWGVYSTLIGSGLLLFTVIEATSTMFIGMALFKLGILQGERTTRFYWAMLALCYGFGVIARYVAVHEELAFDLAPKIGWGLQEYARLAVTAGHIAAVNLAVRLAGGRTLLAPFKAAGQLAFTIYFLQQITGLYVMYSPAGLHMPSAPGWAHILLYATIVNAVLLVFANLWVRNIGMGPMEWLLRSLAYWKRQPLKAPAG
ncbi:MAG: DUF418 domain-containing protein [Croceibacterium sp.]